MLVFIINLVQEIFKLFLLCLFYLFLAHAIFPRGPFRHVQYYRIINNTKLFFFIFPASYGTVCTGAYWPSQPQLIPVSKWLKRLELVATPPWMGSYSIARFPLAFHQASMTICWYHLNFKYMDMVSFKFLKYFNHILNNI